VIRKVAIVIFFFAWTLTTHGKYSASGDEPHYLMMAQSIVADHDLDLANNYANNDGRLFGHDHLGSGPHALPTRTGQLRPVHDPGLAVLLLPVYVTGQAVARLPTDAMLERVHMTRGLFAYSIISLFLIGLTAFALMLLGYGLSRLADERIAAAVVLMIGLSPPVLSYSFLVFPEVVAMALSCTVVWFVLKAPEERDRVIVLALALAAGLLPWMHHKFLLYAAGLLLLVAYKRWSLVTALPRSSQWLAVALFALPQIGLQLLTLPIWGTLTGGLAANGLPFDRVSFRDGVVGLWINRTSGLLAFAPMFWLFPACAVLTFRRTWPFLAVTLLVYLPAAAYVDWPAGFSPAARYLAPLIPLWSVAIADALRYRPVRIAALVLAVPQLVVDAVVWQHPRWLWPADPSNRMLEALGPIGRAYEALLPPIQIEGLRPSASWALLIAAGLCGVIVAAALSATPKTPVVMRTG